MYYRINDIIICYMFFFFLFKKKSLKYEIYEIRYIEGFFLFYRKRKGKKKR